MATPRVQGADSFDFELIGVDKNPFLGYNSSQDKTTVNPQYMVRGSKNVYLKSSKTIANRPGLKTRGRNDATLAGVVSSWVWNNSLGKVLPLRVANNKLQVESSIADGTTLVWYDLLLTSTLTNPAAILTRFVFDSWYSSTDKKDRVLMVRGDALIMYWSGGITKVASGTINTITKKDATTTWNQDGFANQTSGEKKIIINGVEYTYTGGEDTAILTGVSPDASGISDSQIAIQSVLSVSNGGGGTLIGDSGFANDMIKVIGNQAYVASYTSRLVYISYSSDFKNYTVPTPPVAGSAELLTLDNAVKGIAVRQGNAWITAGTKDWYEVTFSNITVGSTLERQTVVSKKPTSELSAAYAHEFIDNWGDDIIYLAQDQQVRDIGTFIGVLNGQKFPSLSIPIMDELAEENFIGGHLKIIGEPRLGNVLYITAPVNGRDYMFTVLEEANDQGGVTQQRIWHPPHIRNVSRFESISGITYGHSNSNPMIYRIWDTNQWHDDSPSGEALPYVSVMQMAYRSFGRRQGKFVCNKMLAIGYMNLGSTLDANILFDYQGATAVLNPNISSNNSPATSFLSQSDPSLGDASLGDNPLGDGLLVAADEQDLLPKFYKISILSVNPFYEIGVQIYSQKADDRWEILALGFNPWLSEEQGVQLQN